MINNIRDEKLNFIPDIDLATRNSVVDMAKDHPDINRLVTEDEYDEALQIAKSEGLWRFA